MPDQLDQPPLLPELDTGLQAALWHAGNDWNAAWRRRHEAVPDVLYHYTDAAGIRGIVQTKKLWASNAAYLNDSTEIVYVKEVLEQATAELKSEHDEPVVGEFLELATALQTLVVSTYDAFVSCFCEDADLLSQWRGYPPSGGGYSIGFKTAIVFQGRMISQIIYDPERQRKILRSLLAPACDLLATGDAAASAEYLSRATSLALQMTTPNIALCSFAFKHPGFCEEKEWRLIRVMVRGTDPPAGGTTLFRERGQGLLPYTLFDLERDANTEKPIATVTVGPTAHPDLTASATRQLLQSEGYHNADEMVTNSKIPLRV